MTLDASHVLAKGGPLSIRPRPDRSELILKDLLDAAAGEPGDADGPWTQGLRRTRIWELHGSLHCSIIGTCLATAELRHILDKLQVGGAGASDHHLHTLGVAMAGRRDGGAKFVQKALDRRHRVAITRCAKAKDPAALLGLWEESQRQGDIPGAYWATLTHPSATDDVVKRVFGDVHMLSHLVGAANRADIRRLCQLEEENAALAAKIERQQRQLRDGFADRDETIRHLRRMLADQPGEPPGPADASPREGDAALDKLVRDLTRRLDHETVRRERSEQRIGELSAALRERDRALQASRRERDDAAQELATVEAQLAALAEPDTPDLAESLALAETTVLYVGGRANQVPQLKAMIERAGAHCLHHDGGVEHSSALLPGLVSRADHVMFPIDCVSHDAVTAVKKLCRQSGKPYAPLRTASLTCLLAALVRIAAGRNGMAAE